MLRRLLVGVVLVSVAVACGKKKEAQVGDTTGDSTITSSPMSFNAQGSDSGQIEGLSTVFFGYDEASLSAESRATLAKNADWMKKNSNVTLQVEGHCDERGSIEYNLALGERRAKAVKAYLVSLGVDSKKVTVISYGKEKKLMDGDSEEAHSKNRRANFVPLGN